jgi:hypothetical protein
MHQYFAADHIRSAKLMADKCRQREDKCVNDNLPVLDFEIRSYALAAITESVAFLEAVVNEFIRQVAYFADENPRLARLEAGTVDRLRREQIDNDPIAKLRLLDKYDLTLSCAGKDPINKGATPRQDVVALIHARNALVHYKTEMHWDDAEHKIEEQVRHLVRSNPLMTKGTRPWFPHHLLCANVAEWAWKKSVELEQIWQRSLGVAFSASSQQIRANTKRSPSLNSQPSGSAFSVPLTSFDPADNLAVIITRIAESLLTDAAQNRCLENACIGSETLYQEDARRMAVRRNTPGRTRT